MKTSEMKILSGILDFVVLAISSFIIFSLIIVLVSEFGQIWTGHDLIREVIRPYIVRIFRLDQ